MDKRMIEEMAKIMLETAFENYEPSGSVEIDTEVRRHCYHAFLSYCATLYNAGYRKIPEGSVVLTNDEFWALSNKFSKKELDEIVEFHKKKTRKETAEKFAERLKAVGDDGVCHLTFYAIDEIAKEIMEGK